MRIVIQRVSKAKVDIEGKKGNSIGRGLVVFLGIEGGDERGDAEWLCRKVLSMRIFNDEEGKMNLSVSDVGGNLLLISQFTLHASTKKGHRPSYMRAAPPVEAIPLYEYFVGLLEQSELTVKTGEFGADMKVALVNDGPVTIIVDSRMKE